MTSSPKVGYSMDTSALLDGWKRYYPPDVFPTVWTHLESLRKSDRLFATEEVHVELKAKLDGTCKWAETLDGLFIPHEPEIQASMTKIINRYPRLIDNRPRRNRADPFVIALAQVRGLTVITGEQGNGNASKPKIPFICGELSIPCIAMIDLFRMEKWIFGI